MGCGQVLCGNLPNWKAYTITLVVTEKIIHTLNRFNSLCEKQQQQKMDGKILTVLSKMSRCRHMHTKRCSREQATVFTKANLNAIVHDNNSCRNESKTSSAYVSWSSLVNKLYIKNNLFIKATEAKYDFPY